MAHDHFQTPPDPQKNRRFSEKEVRRFRFEPPDPPDHYALMIVGKLLDFWYASDPSLQTQRQRQVNICLYMCQDLSDQVDIASNRIPISPPRVDSSNGPTPGK